jgi:putative ABC transport system permease protein
VKIIRLGLALFWRDWRAGELQLLVASIVIAVAAMTSVGFFADRLRLGLERDAAQLLGADLIVSSDDRIAPSFFTEAERVHLEMAQTIVFPSMALAGDAARLASVKAVSGGYPLRGTLRTSLGPTLEDGPTAGRPEPSTIWVDPALLTDLKVGLGAHVKIGDADFTIARLVTLEPDSGLSFVTLAPRVLMRYEDLPATHLIQPTSRVSYHLLVAGDAAVVRSYSAWVKEHLTRGVRIESLEAGRPEVRSTLDRAEQFLSLVALLTAMLAALAIALGARRFTERHLDACAVMRCLGSSQSEVLGLLLVEFLSAGVLASLIGALLGFAAHFIFLAVLGSILKRDLPPAHLATAVQGVLVGLTLLVGFALPPILQLRRVSPIRVLRRDLGVPSASAFGMYSFGAVLFVLLLVWTARSIKIGLITAAGFGVALLLFTLLALLALWLLSRFRTLLTGQAWLRFALAAVQRRKAAAVVQIVALAIGLMALLLLSVTREDLITGWRHSAPPDAPNRFAINIEPDQKEPFAKMIHQAGVANLDLAPMVRGRLIAINGTAVSANNYQDMQTKRLVEREFNLSYQSEAPAYNHIVAGSWFKPDATDELSIEQGIAESLKVKLGDRLAFDVAGQKVEARITSIRKLEWDSMHVNFFVIFPPAALKDISQTWISAFHLDSNGDALTHQVVAAYPNITVINMQTVLKQIQDILDQVITAVEFLFSFTLVTGLLVLYAALLSSRDERVKEAALLRALGASSGQLRRAHLAEFAVIGFLAGLLAAMGAVVFGEVLATQVFGFAYILRALPWLLGIGGGLLIALLGAWFALRPVLGQPPLVTLREA